MVQLDQDELNKQNQIVMEDIGKTLNVTTQLDESLLLLQIAIEDIKAKVLNAKLKRAMELDQPLKPIDPSIPTTISDAIVEVEKNLGQLKILTREYADEFSLFMSLIELVNNSYREYDGKLTDIMANWSFRQHLEHSDFLQLSYDPSFENPSLSNNQDTIEPLSSQVEPSENTEGNRNLNSGLDKSSEIAGTVEEPTDDDDDDDIIGLSVDESEEVKKVETVKPDTAKPSEVISLPANIVPDEIIEDKNSQTATPNPAIEIKEGIIPATNVPEEIIEDKNSQTVTPNTAIEIKEGIIPATIVPEEIIEDKNSPTATPNTAIEIKEGIIPAIIVSEEIIEDKNSQTPTPNTAIEIKEGIIPATIVPEEIIEDKNSQTVTPNTAIEINEGIIPATIVSEEIIEEKRSQTATPNTAIEIKEGIIPATIVSEEIIEEKKSQTATPNTAIKSDGTNVPTDEDKAKVEASTKQDSKGNNQEVKDVGNSDKLNKKPNISELFLQAEDEVEKQIQEAKALKAETPDKMVKQLVKNIDDKATGKNKPEDLVGQYKTGKGKGQQMGAKSKEVQKPQDKNIKEGGNDKTKNEDLKKDVVKPEPKEKPGNDLGRKSGTFNKPQQQDGKQVNDKDGRSNVQKGNKTLQGDANKSDNTRNKGRNSSAIRGDSVGQEGKSPSNVKPLGNEATGVKIKGSGVQDTSTRNTYNPEGRGRVKRGRGK